MKNDVNFNVSDQYVQPSRNIGSTAYYNVNTNTSTVVPWGTLDWLNASLGLVLTLSINGALIYFIGHWTKVW